MKTRYFTGILLVTGSLVGCSTILDPDREFAEPITGSVIIAKDVLSPDEKPKGCDAKPKSQQEQCKKQVDELTDSITNAKKKRLD
ncbi:hypothetical protein [Aliikangiella sp. G2MR2-5]|uniref:hypothetical protein n=1 Tax=Aliikangiella sp. G2MR2-5 TaxID=2788943 RepID=UPI0018AA0201|nr:hypothetical protein [Aliikangiella sp. G2MR2-5]